MPMALTLLREEKKKKKKRKRNGRTEFFHAGGPSFSDLPCSEYVGLSGALLHISSLSLPSTFQIYSHIYIMSFLFGGAPKMSSAEKIAAAETEVEMISDMFNR